MAVGGEGSAGCLADTVSWLGGGWQVPSWALAAWRCSDPKQQQVLNVAIHFFMVHHVLRSV